VVQTVRKGNMGSWRDFLDDNPYALEFMRAIERRVDFRRWAFRLAFAGEVPTHNVLLVYQCQKCRVRFGYSRGRFAGSKNRIGEAVEEEVFYGYGRLHAPDTEDTLTISGKEYVAWHNPFLLLDFLEYRRGNASVEEVAASSRLSLTSDKIRQEAEARGVASRLDAWASRIAISWEWYAAELFNVLDLECPQLWEEYRAYRRDLWEAIKGRKQATMGDRAEESIKLLSLAYDQEII
jgi:hypothetical protein